MILSLYLSDRILIFGGCNKPVADISQSPLLYQLGDSIELIISSGILYLLVNFFAGFQVGTLLTIIVGRANQMTRLMTTRRNP